MKFNLPEAEYHAAAALSASGAWAIAQDCPAIYWHTSPFNPNAERPETSKDFDIGTALHLAVLEPARREARIVVIEADDWRTKAAKEARDAAYAAGKVPLLPKNGDLVDEMRKALLAHEWTADLLRGASTEVSFFWDAEGIPCKARADLISRDGRMADLKTSASASPSFFQRQAWNNGHFLRAPFYQDGWMMAGGKPVKDYWFVVVGKDAPHLITPIRLDDRALAWGRLMARRAIDLFRRCRDEGRWPGYTDGPMTIGLPTWAEYQLADREASGDFAPSAADVRRAAEFLEP